MGIPLDERKRVGFWAPPKTKYDTVFGAVLGALMEGPLPRAEDHVDLSWDRREREAVLHYVENQAFRDMSYMGFSLCRFCFCHNGSADFSDGTYVWPQGFGHYIREHGVKPPQDFIDHILMPRQRRRRKTSR